MPRAVLVDGTKLDGVAGLRDALVKYSPQFVRVITEKLMIYGAGPRNRILRHAAGPLHRARRREEQLQVFVAGAGSGQERAVPDESETDQCQRQANGQRTSRVASR